MTARRATRCVHTFIYPLGGCWEIAGWLVAGSTPAICIFYIYMATCGPTAADWTHRYTRSSGLRRERKALKRRSATCAGD